MVRRFALGIAVLMASIADAQIVSVNLDTAGNTWTYVVSYSFEAGQTAAVNSFYLPVGAPVSNFRIEGDDHGWVSESDGLTYVRWYNPDPEPSADDIHTGEFMVFLLDSPEVAAMPVSTSLTTWNPSAGVPGLTLTANTFAPVPEPGSLVALSLGALALLKKRRKVPSKLQL